MTVEMTPTEHQQQGLHPGMHQLSPIMPIVQEKSGSWKVVTAWTPYTWTKCMKATTTPEAQSLTESMWLWCVCVAYHTRLLYSIYGTAVEAVHTLGIERKRADKLLLIFHMHAINTLHAMVTLRRKLEGCFKNRRSLRNCPT